ncbi:hypothetical protein [Paenibacillus dakarensis]|uniref:hypothetical protein n=1 Tax=Paenibacillus dakarensis TaxID=1527293 RepID=UPI0006D59855|nr:hypothetical protein [Paenibacillus dakarensis]
MSNSVSKWFAALLSVLLLYMVPAGESARRQDDLSRIVVFQSLTKFVDSVRMKGYLTPQMYQDFLRELEVTGNIYEVGMEHQHKKYEPDYEDSADPKTFLNSYTIVYDTYYDADILGLLFPDKELPPDDPDRMYKLTAGDYFQVKIKSLNQTPYILLFDALTGSNSGDKPAIAFPYGGMVLNEDY